MYVVLYMGHPITATLYWRICLLFTSKLKRSIKANAKEIIEKTVAWSGKVYSMPVSRTLCVCTSVHLQLIPSYSFINKSAQVILPFFNFLLK